MCTPGNEEEKTRGSKRNKNTKQFEKKKELDPIFEAIFLKKRKKF